MQPIVDGLEIEYKETFEFQQINASTSKGLKIFNGYSLFGHPAYLILNQNGDVLWQSVGQQPFEVVEQALQSAIQ